MDIAATTGSASSGHGIVWWKNTDGNGTFSKTLNIATSFLGNSIFTADTDNDGDQDIISAGTAAGISVWENNLIEYGE